MDEKTLRDLVIWNLETVKRRDLTVVEMSTLIAFKTFEVAGRPELLEEYSKVQGKYLEQKKKEGTLDYSLFFTTDGDLGSSASDREEKPLES